MKFISQIVFEDKWLQIIHAENKPKTKVFNVISKCSNSHLGKILWYPHWRHYVYDDGTSVYSDRCLQAITDFVTKQNLEHKGTKK